MQGVIQQTLKRIHGKRRGWVFTPKDFLDLGGRAAVDQALSRLTRRGAICRLRRGLYEYPRISRRLGQLSPAPDAVAEAVARKTGSRLQVSGARAANALGLSTQVPARSVYLTDGPSRQVQIGRQTIYLRQARRFAGAGKVSAVVYQALSHLGRDRVDDAVVRKLSRSLSQKDKSALVRDAKYASAWMQSVLTKVAQVA
ncbi:MAG: hypothetical protein GTN62_05660 [Gemmatimonadales bacterium]|nr:hypothetical protein [Gemmatimonadales bacterium]NIN10990.1 hypothetical protein [Gemmatimonadales bacterium]NIN49582.1 hypothetical protein [Gemmatimonadales bacterium]NIP07046.1 hypothetical protein [Gemmatimonadales bacterium]NIR01681.1 hypothetical protein [Gemmatimonadales bacterium]